MVWNRISIVQGDITRETGDAIVNAANTTLLGGGGVDGAIHRAAGPQLLEECRRLGGCPTGEAKITAGHRLAAPWVIHTAGPVWRGGLHGEEGLLARCYRNCLALARERRLNSISFPSISTGAYGFPVDRASAIALREISAFLRENAVPSRIRIVCFDERTLEAYRAAQARQQAEPKAGSRQLR
jgi:O-acetyl-ADP-ribose deacetylase (regulator of RNase III)